MFKNREIRVRLHKTDPEATEDIRAERVILEDKIALVHRAVKDIVKTVVVGVAAYVVLDTARQIAVDKTTN